MVDEIREAWKYVFQHNDDRLTGYSSAYWRKRNLKKGNINSEVAE